MLETGVNTHPRYHSNCGLKKPPLFRIKQSLCLYAAVTGEPTNKSIQPSGSEAMGYIRINAAGSHRPPALLKQLLSTVFVKAFINFLVL